MTDLLSDSAAITLQTGFRFQWEETQDAYVLLYPEGMVKLGQSASQILKRCDGTMNSEAIVADLELQFPGADLREDVLEFLQTAGEKGWIRVA
jgi:pyrroloquinoline quinone biosynthesis protein D